MKKLRLRLIVLSDFQKWFLMRFLLSVGSLFVFFGLSAYVWFSFITEEVLETAGIVSPVLQRILREHLLTSLTLSMGLLIFIFFVAIFQAYLISRTIAGPIFALSRQLDQLNANPELGRNNFFRLRRGDLFLDLVGKLNKLAKKISGKPTESLAPEPSQSQ